MILASWSSAFHGAGMEEGPEGLAAALGGEVRRVPFAAPSGREALPGGLRDLADAVEVAAGGASPLLALVGECTLAPAVSGGLRRRHPDVAVVWIDAHGDLNTPDTSPSGFLGGMPLAVALGRCHDDLRRAAGLEPPLAAARAVLVGGRDLDAGERALLDGGGALEAPDATAALAALPADAPLHVHLDVDVLDPAVAPAVDFPAPGGWDAERLRAAAAALGATGRVVGVSVCPGNPRRDPEGRTPCAVAPALAALGLVAS